jgi:hypothetical protein
MLGTYSLINVALSAMVVIKLGWISVAAVFLISFFMSISFPTFFALSIYGLSVQVKKASAFIVMAILGGAIMPKLMGHLGDVYNMSVAFLMPLGCFLLIAVYGYSWPALAGIQRIPDQGRAGGAYSDARDRAAVRHSTRRAVPPDAVSVPNMMPTLVGFVAGCDDNSGRSRRPMAHRHL